MNPLRLIAKRSQDKETQQAGGQGTERAAEAAQRPQRRGSLSATPTAPQWLRRDVIGLIHKMLL